MYFEQPQSTMFSFTKNTGKRNIIPLTPVELYGHAAHPRQKGVTDISVCLISIVSYALLSWDGSMDIHSYGFKETICS